MSLETMTMEQLDLLITLVEEKLAKVERIHDALLKIKQIQTQKKTASPRQPQAEVNPQKEYKYYASRDRIHESIIALGVSTTVGEIKTDLETRFRVKAKTEDIEALLNNNEKMFESVADDRWLAIRWPDDEQ